MHHQERRLNPGLHHCCSFSSLILYICCFGLEGRRENLRGCGILTDSSGQFSTALGSDFVELLSTLALVFARGTEGGCPTVAGKLVAASLTSVPERCCQPHLESILGASVWGRGHTAIFWRILKAVVLIKTVPEYILVDRDQGELAIRAPKPNCSGNQWPSGDACQLSKDNEGRWQRKFATIIP